MGTQKNIPKNNKKEKNPVLLNGISNKLNKSKYLQTFYCNFQIFSGWGTVMSR